MSRISFTYKIFTNFKLVSKCRAEFNLLNTHKHMHTHTHTHPHTHTHMLLYAIHHSPGIPLLMGPLPAPKKRPSPWLLSNAIYSTANMTVQIMLLVFSHLHTSYLKCTPVSDMLRLLFVMSTKGCWILTKKRRSINTSSYATLYLHLASHSSLCKKDVRRWIHSVSLG